MPCLIRHLLMPPSTGPAPPDLTVDSMADALQYESHAGVYAVFATWHGHRVACLSRHLDRLEDSADRAGFSLTLDRERLCAHLRQVLADTGFDEAKFRISASPNSDILTVSAEPYLGPPTDLQLRGVRCETVADVTRSNPRAKQTQWIRRRSEFGHSEVYERLLIDQSGGILEGMGSNFYVIRQSDSSDKPDGETHARPVLQTADAGILPGIARTIVLEVAHAIAAVDLTPPKLAELDHFSESFLTSASRGVVPIVEIDGQQVGSGYPGPITRRLIALYNSRAQALEEPL